MMNYVVCMTAFVKRQLKRESDSKRRKITHEKSSSRPEIASMDISKSKPIEFPTYVIVYTNCSSDFVKSNLNARTTEPNS